MRRPANRALQSALEAPRPSIEDDPASPILPVAEPAGDEPLRDTASSKALRVEGLAEALRRGSQGKAHSVAISLVGIIPINAFDIYGRIGYAHSELKFNASGPLGGVGNQNDRQDEATYGAGVRWNFHPNWGVFAEWIKNDRIRIDSYVAGVDYRF